MGSVAKIFVWLAALVSVALGQDPLAILSSPLSLPNKVCHIRDEDPPRKLRQRIRDDLSLPGQQDASFYFCLAERMKRVGDYRAEKFYEKAIQADGENPNYELFYGDYLRNFRGAQAPLFPQAEEHYFAALSKIQDLTGGNLYPRSETDTQSLVERGLVVLYQEDGVPLAYRYDQSRKKPYVFFSTIDRYQQSPADLDREADVRDYTSEALFAESPGEHGLLSPLAFRRLIRNKKAFETLDGVRFRYEAWPAIDVFYTHRQTDNAQITDFRLFHIDDQVFSPQANFNELRQNDFGIAARKPLDLALTAQAALLNK